MPERAGLGTAGPNRFALWREPELLRRLAPRYPRQPRVGQMAGRDAALAAYRKPHG